MSSRGANCVQNGGVHPERPSSPSLDTRLSDILDGVAGVVAVGLVAASLIGSQGTPRILLALAFLLFVPGRAITSNWDRLGLRSQATVSMLFSLVVLALLATATLWVHYWHPIGLMQAEAGLSVLGLTVAAARRHWYHGPDAEVAGDSGANFSGRAIRPASAEELANIMRGGTADTADPHPVADSWGIDSGESAVASNPPSQQ
jgi:hypothetical protein